MAEKEQFDQLLGGSQELPHDVPIMKFISARAAEIAAMTYSIDNPQQTKLIFQKLPVHMRRRVMSHNAKRLPRKYREAHLRQMAKSGLPPKNKRPSRKYRRRPHNLLSEYNRRQRNTIWLETHIWHAKRFHMIEKWGHKIPNFANDKCFRANYRATTKHCLMQDLSYYSCIEIGGPESILQETLKTHCNPFGLTFNAKIYLTGNREGTLMFFARNGYPPKPIGNVRFLWKPTKTDIKTIWIWVHPAFYEELLEEIVLSFEFVLSTPTFMDTKSPCVYINDKSCQMILLKNTLNRFRLCGPLTFHVLIDALRLPNVDQETGCFKHKDSNHISESSIMDINYDTTENMPMPDFNIQNSIKDASGCTQSWDTEYYKIQDNLGSLKNQVALWEELRTLESPNQLPPNIVLGFTVLDPRFNIPHKRTKTSRRDSFSVTIPLPPINSNVSPIWDMKIRNKVSASCSPNSKINKLRSTCLVPGISNDNNFSEDIMTKIPLLLIQISSSSNAGICTGMDIILPAQWAMAFWLAFVFRSVRVGALRESQSIAFQNFCIDSPDINEPDTAAYEKEALCAKKEFTEKYFRRPPNKRVNFIKLSISSPFYCEWKILMKEWSQTEDFYILRNRRLLLLLQEKLLCQNIKAANKVNVQYNNSRDLFESKNVLVCIKVSILRKGRPKQFSIICIPTTEDLVRLRNNKHWAGPVETLKKDPNVMKRKFLRKNHLAFLKRCRKQRIRNKKGCATKICNLMSEPMHKEAVVDHVKYLSKNGLCSKQHTIIEQSERMSKLYLPNCSQVRFSCDREVMGYVTLGDFSFNEAKGIGIGYITLESLMSMIDNNSNMVLVRNIQTRQYRFAKLDILFR